MIQISLHNYRAARRSPHAARRSPLAARRSPLVGGATAGQVKDCAGGEGVFL